MATLSLLPSILLHHSSSTRTSFQSTSLRIPLFNQKTPNLHIYRTHNSNPNSWSSSSSVVTDETVPEGHAGLHGLLYGDKGAQVHDGLDSSHTSPQPIAGEDDGSSIIPIHDYLKSRNLKFGGVYAIYDSQNQIQYVGYSRNVVLSLKSHMDRVGNSLCCSVRAKMMFTDSSIVSRQTLEQEMNKWVEQYGMPPGNSDSTQKELWENGLKGAPISVMSREERDVYNDKKFKLRKAMGENLYDDDGEDDDDDSRMRKLKLLNATDGDDWSAVIDGQTKETLDHTQNSVDKNVVSPFSGQGTSGLYSAAIYNLTVENVDMVLNDVRPYLVSDGGNVEVASVEDGVISLRLQGACGTCPSSTTTMKMGIERVLKEKFGDALKEVRQVDQQDIGASVASVNSHLDMLRPAIHNYGGSVEVLSVEGGDCHVKFNGPGSIGMGIQAAIKDKFPDITNVVLITT